MAVLRLHLLALHGIWGCRKGTARFRECQNAASLTQTCCVLALTCTCGSVRLGAASLSHVLSGLLGPRQGICRQRARLSKPPAAALLQQPCLPDVLYTLSLPPRSLCL
jgi:hypothetical protein